MTHGLKSQDFVISWIITHFLILGAILFLAISFLFSFYHLVFILTIVVIDIIVETDRAVASVNLQGGTANIYMYACMYVYIMPISKN